MPRDILRRIFCRAQCLHLCTPGAWRGRNEVAGAECTAEGVCIPTAPTRLWMCKSSGVFQNASVNVQPRSQGVAHEKGIRLSRGTREGSSHSETCSLQVALCECAFHSCTTSCSAGLLRERKCMSQHAQGIKREHPDGLRRGLEEASLRTVPSSSISLPFAFFLSVYI